MEDLPLEQLLDVANRELRSANTVISPEPTVNRGFAIASEESGHQIDSPQAADAESKSDSSPPKAKEATRDKAISLPMLSTATERELTLRWENELEQRKLTGKHFHWARQEQRRIRADCRSPYH